MSTPPHRLWVYRNGKWQTVMSDQILPHDLVSLTRAQPNSEGGDDDAECPADVLLLHGSCVVNEKLQWPADVANVIPYLCRHPSLLPLFCLRVSQSMVSGYPAR